VHFRHVSAKILCKNRKYSSIGEGGGGPGPIPWLPLGQPPGYTLAVASQL